MRRPADSAELDFYADKYGGLKSAAGSNLAAWLQGGALGKVAALYDQSVYGLHLASNAGTTDVDIVPTPWVSNLAYVVPAESNYAYPPVALSTNSDISTVSNRPYGNGTYLVSQSGSLSTSYSRNVFDKSNSTFWQTLSGLYDSATGQYVSTQSFAGINGEWIRIDMPDALKLYNYTITPRNTYVNTPPVEFKILGSSNNGNTWTIIDDVVATNYTATNVPRNFEIASPNDGYYSSLAIVVTRVGNSGQTSRNRVNISELVFYGRPRLAVPLSPPAYKAFNSDWVLQCRSGKPLTRATLPITTNDYVSFFARVSPQFQGPGDALGATFPQYLYYAPSNTTGVGFFGNFANAPLGFGTAAPANYTHHWLNTVNRTDAASLLLNTRNNARELPASGSLYVDGAPVGRRAINSAGYFSLVNNKSVEIAGFDGQLQTLGIFNTAFLSDAAGAALHQMHKTV